MNKLLESYLIYLQKGITEKASSYTASMLSAASRKLYQDYLSVAQRACEGLEGLDGSICNTSIKITGMRRLISDMRKNTAKCNQANDPVKCRDLMRKKIARQEDKLTKLNKNLSMYRARAGR